MLPDTLQNLPRDERYAYARLLAYMARVDEEITVDELAMFEQQLGKALLSPNQREVLRRSLKSPPTLEECLDGLGPEAGRLALRDAVLMAASDGTVDDDEDPTNRLLKMIWKRKQALQKFGDKIVFIVKKCI